FPIVYLSSRLRVKAAPKGLWTLDFGLWTLDFGPWTLDFGLWTLDFGLWTLDFGLWTVGYIAFSNTALNSSCESVIGFAFILLDLAAFSTNSSASSRVIP